MNWQIDPFGERLRPWYRAVLGCYWLAMFGGTHWPNFHLDDYPQNTDKILHFLAYAGLGFLFAAYLSTKRKVGWRELGGIFAIAALYSIADELLQIPVGRSCDFFDAVADWAGCLIGLLAFVGLRWTLWQSTAISAER